MLNEKEFKFMLNPMDIVSLIIKYREERNLSLDELSKLVNTSKSTLSRIEKRETEKIDYGLVMKLKQVLQIPDEDILMSMNYMNEEAQKQNMELIENSFSNHCSVCNRTTYGDQNIQLNQNSIKDLRLGYRNQCQVTPLCRTCRENLMNLLKSDLEESSIDDISTNEINKVREDESSLYSDDFDLSPEDFLNDLTL